MENGSADRLPDGQRKTPRQPNDQEWDRLYRAGIQVKALAPWEWMKEDDLFGVQNPESGELGFVSVMGMLGEHYSIALYLGPKGLFGFWYIEERGPFLAPEQILEVPQLQAAFLDRNELTAKDRDTIKRLGFKFRGRQAWLQFRSYRPGHFPWYLEDHEARFLAIALEQLLDVAPRFCEDPTLLFSGSNEKYLVRVFQEEKWVDRLMAVPRPEPEPISLVMDMRALESLQQMPKRLGTLEVDLFLLPAPIGERGERPRCAYVLMAVEQKSGLPLGSEMLMAEPTLQAMYGQVPLTLVYQMAQSSFVPRKVCGHSELLLSLLKPLAESLGFELEMRPTLPALEKVKGFLLRRFGV